MIRHRDLVGLMWIAGAVLLAASEASAQPLGLFRWQLAPHCNVVTLNVTGQGAVFTLDGFDDQCGAGQRASVVGTAFLNPDGTVGMGLTTVLAPGGAFVHVDARITLPSLGGPWRDSAGNTGTFIFTPLASTGGPPRTVAPNGLAPGSVTATQLAPAAVSGIAIADASITTADILDGPRAAFASGEQGIFLSPAGEVVRSVTLIAPTAGTVIVNASGGFWFAGGGKDGGRCYLTTGPERDIVYSASAIEYEPTPLHTMPFALTRGFTVAAGAFTVNLYCSAVLGTIQVQHTSLTALFVAGG